LFSDFLAGLIVIFGEVDLGYEARGLVLVYSIEIWDDPGVACEENG
jgi:hypothetical protein